MRTDALNWALWTCCSFSKTYGRDRGGLTLVSFRGVSFNSMWCKPGAMSKAKRPNVMVQVGVGPYYIPLLAMNDLERHWKKVIEFIVKGRFNIPLLLKASHIHFHKQSRLFSLKYKIVLLLVEHNLAFGCRGLH